MTTELVIMNKEAVALAADSAATITREKNKKIYNTNKLFMLSKSRPIGIMFYANSELNMVPWETIIKLYRDLPNKKFDTLKGYAEHFISFLNGQDNPYYDILFPAVTQEHVMSALVNVRFYNITKKIDKQTNAIIERDGKIEKIALNDLVKKAIQDDYDKMKRAKNLGVFPDNYNVEIIKKYESLILKCKEENFRNLPVFKKALNQLKEIACNLIIKDRFFRKTGVVIAGFGDREIFPSLVSFTTDFIVNNKLKYKEDKYIPINFSQDAWIAAFAQEETIDSFLFGVHPEYYSEMANAFFNLITKEIPEKILEQCDELDESKKKSLKEKMEASGADMYNTLFKKMVEQSGTHFISIFEAIKYLPKEELATMAESLVNLTSFKKRMSLEAEDVGGPCDVAVISKGDGFIWVKRKHYFRKELNPQFFMNFNEGQKKRGEEVGKQE